MKDYDKLYEKHSKSIEQLSKQGMFKCPICGNTFPYKEEHLYVKCFDVSLTGYSSFGTASATQYTETYLTVSVCKECSRKNDKTEAIIFYIGFSVFCLIIAIFAYYYFCIQDFWLSNLSFITKNLSERSIWSFLGWSALIFSLYVWVYLYSAMLCRNFFTSVQNISNEEAIKSNAIGRENPRSVRNKFYVPYYK